MVGESTPAALSAQQLMAVLENAPVAIAVSATDSKELLYANKMAEELFLSVPRRQALTCYQAMGYDQPCPFCQSKNMNRTKLLVRNFQCSGSDRIYQLSGKLIDWGEKPAHIEYILDVTQAKQEEEQARAIKEELSAIFSSIPCGLCVYRFEGTKLSPIFRNPAFYDIMGCSEEYIRTVGRESGYQDVHPEDLPLLQEKIRQTIQSGGVLQHTYRVWNDQEQQYRWIRLEGSVKAQADGTKLLYGVYSDVSTQMRLEKELTDANNKMQDIINAIPGGVAIYKVSDIFETMYFSDGVPELSGYTVKEYRELIKGDATAMTYWEDTAMVVAKTREAVNTHAVVKFEFRKQHRDGHIVWVRVQMKWIGEEGGSPLIHCVFHNISDQKEAQLELDHLINSIPGGIASYRVEGGRFIPTYFSDGVAALAGYTREELEALVSGDAFQMIYETDRDRVIAATKVALESGGVLDVSYRMRHKNGKLLWLHCNGRRMDPLAETVRFYAVFTGMSEETRMFQSIANETADGIYVIDKANYDLLYVNEARELFAKGGDAVGKKCYFALHGKNEPCEFCTLNDHAPDGKEHAMNIPGVDRYYSIRFRETRWSGIPAYVKYVQDTTEEVRIQREKERLEQYFKTVVNYFPGGIGVVRYKTDGSMVPEFLSDGFAAITGMTLEEAWRLYRLDAMAGVHPDDQEQVKRRMRDIIDSGESGGEITYRLKKGDGSYIWVKNMLTITRNEGENIRVYAGYRDITKEREEQELLRQQYNEMIIHYYRASGPNALILGHCNVTQNRILEIIDHTGSELFKDLGTVRDDFFFGLASLVTDEMERKAFLDMYLNVSALAAFQRGQTELIQKCYIKLPHEERGRHVQFKVNLIETPDSNDLTGILAMTDITELVISDRILHQLSVTSYDLVLDVDLFKDRYTILSGDFTDGDTPGQRQGCHSERVACILRKQLLPKDRESTADMLNPAYMLNRLQRENAYSFTYTVLGKAGDIHTKCMTVSAADLRLGRVCMARTDITDSVREQQGLLNIIAYTFELLVFIDIDTNQMTLYTRQTVLENMPPFVAKHYDTALKRLYGFQDPDGRAALEERFRLETMLRCLAEKPSGYDFVLPYQSDEGLRYKQINVLWGDDSHKTVCMVRADVTDMLAAERQSQTALEKALALAEEANHAKSKFLSSMSHDIRTPMNAIMGMTALAIAHLDDRTKLEDCLKRITFSSKHLLSLINDILDMSKIERAQITLSRMKIDLSLLMNQLIAMMELQAKTAGLQFETRVLNILHPYFYGDALRINQVLINILANAMKFTPEGGKVDFQVEEVPPLKQGDRARYRFTVRDTGIGMSEDFLLHIFEPFVRNLSASRVEGTGLGLSITKGLVDLMEGDISVESRLRQGTTFRVELEYETAPNGENTIFETKAEFSASEKEKVFAGRCFLVVEDNAINSEILCELLQMFDARSVVRTDGKQAVQAFREASPGTYDAILMDIQMPEMNGYEATRTIRKLERPDAGTIPIIAMTANAFSEDIQAALDAGMTAHVAKPIDFQVLQITLSRIFGGVNGAS